VNHPALVKTSDQASFSSADFSPFTSAEALRSSDISPVPYLNLKPNSRGGTTEKIKSSHYRKFVEATQIKKIKEATNPKPVDLGRMLFLVLQKDGGEGFAGLQLRLTLHHIRKLTQLFLSLTIGRKEIRNKTLIVCSVLVVSLKTTMERTRYDA